jgi:hypothetical protein
MPDPSVAEVTFYANQGSTFRRRLWYGWSTKPPEQVLSIADIDEMYDLSGCTAEMFIRTYDRSQIIHRLSTEDLIPGIILNAVQGSIDLFISDVDTDLWVDKKYRHDLELTYTTSGDVIKKYKGTIFNEVTNTREI